MGNITGSDLDREIAKRKEICKGLGVDCDKDPYYQQLMGVLKSPIPTVHSPKKSRSKTRKTINKSSKIRIKSKSPRNKITKSKSPKSTRRTSRRKSFGYTHDNNGQMYGVHYDDNILLANDAFGWNSPLDRALNAGSG